MPPSAVTPGQSFHPEVLEIPAPPGCTADERTVEDGCPASRVQVIEVPPSEHCTRLRVAISYDLAGGGGTARVRGQIIRRISGQRSSIRNYGVGVGHCGNRTVAECLDRVFVPDYSDIDIACSKQKLVTHMRSGKRQWAPTGDKLLFTDCDGVDDINDRKPVVVCCDLWKRQNQRNAVGATGATPSIVAWISR